MNDSDWKLIKDNMDAELNGIQQWFERIDRALMVLFIEIAFVGVLVVISILLSK